MVRDARVRTTKAKVESYAVLMPLLKAMYGEFKEFSKRKPEAVQSKRKVELVNRLLRECRSLLEAEQSVRFLDLLDEDDLPQNSDLTLVLSQYVAAMEQFSEVYCRWNGVETGWHTSD